MIKINIIGSGWVGMSIGKGFTKFGYKVVFYDIIDKDLPNFTKDINYAIKSSDFSFVCVPTPTKNNQLDLSYIKEVSKKIGKVFATHDKYHVVVIKSTVLPGTTEKLIIPILERYSNKKAGDFGICVSPEFITKHEHSWSNDPLAKIDFFNEKRIVIGEFDERAGNTLEKIYRPLNEPIFRTDLRTAEMIKYASNAMLATKISYWNEIFLICNKLGIDSQTVANIVSFDSRIGKYGTIHGKAFGGKCLPKDLKAFIHFVKKFHDPSLLKAVEHINEKMKEKYGVRDDERD